MAGKSRKHLSVVPDLNPDAELPDSDPEDEGSTADPDEKPPKKVEIRWFDLNDQGNAERLMSENRGNIAYVRTLKCWAYWDERAMIWRLDEDGELVRRAVRALRNDCELVCKQMAINSEEPKAISAFRRFMTSSMNIKGVDNLLKAAASFPGVSLSLDAFDRAPEHLGNLSLRESGVRLRKVKQQDRQTMSLGVRFRRAAVSRVWDRFIERIQPEKDVRDWLCRLVGYSLYGQNPERLVVFCKGTTTTGKTQFATAVHAALGDYAAYTNLTILRENLDDKPRPDLLRIFSKRFIWAEETSAAHKLHPDQIKRMSGAGQVAARGMNSNELLSRIPAFTLWVLTNHTPNIEGADEALQARVQVVPFDSRIPAEEVDSELPVRLAAPRTRAAVLAWAVRGWEDYVRMRREGLSPLDPPADSVAAMGARDAFWTEVSDLHKCLSDIAELVPGAVTTAKSLYSAHQQWAALHGEKPATGTAFGRFLTQQGIMQDRQTVDGKWSVVRVGARLTGDWSAISGG